MDEAGGAVGSVVVYWAQDIFSSFHLRHPTTKLHFDYVSLFAKSVLLVSYAPTEQQGSLQLSAGHCSAACHRNQYCWKA